MSELLIDIALQNTTQGYQTISQFGSALVGALIGGLFSILVTIYSIRKNREIKRKRYRRALIGEIELIEAKELHIIAQELSSESELNVVDEVIESMEEMNEAFPDQMKMPDAEQLKRESMSAILPKLTEVNMSTPVFDSNVDKIGTLKTSESKEVIQFYRYITAVKIDITKAVEAFRNEDTEERLGDYQTYIKQLNQDAEALAEQKKECLEALDAGEFIEIDDTYKAIPASEQQS